jgi:hypothetical protein
MFIFYFSLVLLMGVGLCPARDETRFVIRGSSSAGALAFV